jgi:hypothetical protein
MTATGTYPTPIDRDPLTIPDELRPAIEAARAEMEEHRRAPKDLITPWRVRRRCTPEAALNRSSETASAPSSTAA